MDNYVCLLNTLNLFKLSSSITRSFGVITTSWSVFLDFARAIDFGSGLSRFTWYFLVTSRKWVLMIFAVNGIKVNSLYLKNAINTQMSKIGRATAKAVILLTQLLNNIFHTHSVSPSHIASIISCTILTVAGHILIVIFNHHHEIFLGIKIFIGL